MLNTTTVKTKVEKGHYEVACELKKGDLHKVVKFTVKKEGRRLWVATCRYFSLTCDTLSDCLNYIPQYFSTLDIYGLPWNFDPNARVEEMKLMCKFIINSYWGDYTLEQLQDLAFSFFCYLGGDPEIEYHYNRNLHNREAIAKLIRERLRAKIYRNPRFKLSLNNG